MFFLNIPPLLRRTCTGTLNSIRWVGWESMKHAFSYWCIMQNVCGKARVPCRFGDNHSDVAEDSILLGPHASYHPPVDVS